MQTHEIKILRNRTKIPSYRLLKNHSRFTHDLLQAPKTKSRRSLVATDYKYLFQGKKFPTEKTVSKS